MTGRIAALVCAFVLSVTAGLAEAAPQQQQIPFVGRWHFGNPDTCAKDYRGEDVAMEISPKTLRFYESHCTARSIRKLSDIAVRLRLTCGGEGETWRTDTMLTLVDKTDLHEEMLLRVELDSGHVTAYRRCR